jgi:UDP-N-acetylmuramoyl-L-alanyl-D-glutamate--2,6-diaminopimelate ligase
MREKRQTTRRLAELLSPLSVLRGSVEPADSDIPITRITADSREAEPGSLFVAVPGSQLDGRRFAPEAVRRGAAAIIAESGLEEPVEAPVILVRDARRALAELAGEWYDHPGRRVLLVGITGTFGKTSVLTMLEAIMATAGSPIGVIGSSVVGTKANGRQLATSPLTTPDPLSLQHGLALIVKSGVETAAMEVTSQALAQQRVHGLRFALGVFTNLRPLEHLESHGTFRRYVEAKRRFFDHLAPGVPLIYTAGERAVRRLARGHDLVRIGVGRGGNVAVRLAWRSPTPFWIELTVAVRCPLPSLNGEPVQPHTLAIPLRLLGRTHAVNAGLAATTALLLGAAPEAIHEALAHLPTPRRRMEVTQHGHFTVLDDTGSHPESVNVVFEAIRTLPHRRLHVVVAVRGGRGTELNRRYAESIAIWSRTVPLSTMVVTTSQESATPQNRVTAQERNAFTRGLAQEGLSGEVHDRLDDAVRAALHRVDDQDLLLLLGAQGMDDGALVVEQWLREH